ncbi:hypothetical protein H5410_036693 [Solanum commersonii]|uniref:Uncharacterized protein n=1 Tax=Solanum commersonii TaxID=4109 RepID=A0A9J5Y5K6_SOLCO|nr:hypothetical protein H5410_036693 [Solanum commersonii]
MRGGDMSTRAPSNQCGGGGSRARADGLEMEPGGGGYRKHRTPHDLLIYASTGLEPSGRLPGGRFGIGPYSMGRLRS